MTTAILSMLHEPADRNSATRTFRGEPVLRWTLDRLARCARLDGWAVLCWEDQLDAVTPIAAAHDVAVLAKGPRRPVPELDRITAARRWADGWRGGLMSTCDFDAGFYGPWVKELADRVGAVDVLLVPPSAGLVDAALLDALINRAAAEPDHELIFSQAAPGLAGAVVKRPLLERLASARSHPGRLLHYMPDAPMLDPTSGRGCVPVPVAVARTTCRFHLDTARQLDRVAAATVSLNGQLVSTAAEDLVSRVAAQGPTTTDMPREVVLELTTRRASSPVYWPGRHLPIDRADVPPAVARRVLDQVGGREDVRLTIGGVGDPLLHPHVFDVIAAARAAGIAAVHVETDLLAADAVDVARLAACGVDVVSVMLPALSAETYAAVMGVDAYARALGNLKVFVTERARLGAGLPLLVPTFVKCAGNLAEQDAWYDQWLRAVGSAVISGPTDCGGQIPSTAVADMSPPRRRPCARLASRLVVLSDGTATTCEEDVTGRQSLGRIADAAISEIWTNAHGRVRRAHALEQWNTHPVCAGCKEWHRA